MKYIKTSDEFDKKIISIQTISKNQPLVAYNKAHWQHDFPSGNKKNIKIIRCKQLEPTLGSLWENKHFKIVIGEESKIPHPKVMMQNTKDENNSHEH